MPPVVEDWRAVPAEWRGGAVALGNFDGVHRGHQALLAQARAIARPRGVRTVALTFEPHPRGAARRSGARGRPDAGTRLEHRGPGGGG